MDDIYQENILDHYKHPHRKGALLEYDAKEEGTNPSCGDELTLYVKYADEKISDLGFTGEGCAISQAAMSMLGERLIGMTREDAGKLSGQDMYDMLGVAVGPQREKCALLPLRTLQRALAGGTVAKL